MTGMLRLDKIGLKANMQSIRAKTSRLVSKLRNRTTKKSNIRYLPIRIFNKSAEKIIYEILLNFLYTLCLKISITSRCPSAG